MADNFPFQNLNDLGMPVLKASSVTASDSTVLDTTRALFVGTGGDVAVLLKDNTSAVTFKNVPDGSILPVRVTKVMSTNTTASNILALY